MALFNFPSVENIVASTTQYSSGWFQEFQPVIWLSVGITVAVALTIFLVNVIYRGVQYLIRRHHDDNTP